MSGARFGGAMGVLLNFKDLRNNSYNTAQNKLLHAPWLSLKASHYYFKQSQGCFEYVI